MARDANGAVLDDVIAVRYAAPHSFTGEDLLEITTHGGAIAPAAVTAAAIVAGAREAAPGEFTQGRLGRRPWGDLGPRAQSSGGGDQSIGG